MLEFDNMEMAGCIPEFVDENDPRTAVEQLDANYAHGGGWRSFPGFTLQQSSNGKYRLKYPQDPPMFEVARAPFRNQLIVIFEYDWVAVIEGEKLVDVSRMS